MFGLRSRHLLMLLVLAAAVLAAVQLVPAYFQRFQFADFVNQEVKFAVSKRKTAQKVRTEILAEAKDFGIPIAIQDVHITRRGPTFTVEIDYDLPVDLWVYELKWPSHVKVSGEMFDDHN
jgi:hypothetical protein